MKRSLYLILSLVCVAAPTLAQLPIARINNVTVDPFDIGTSRSFYASKGVPTVADPGPVKGRESQRIISDLAEAIDVIRSKHIDGRTVDVGALAKSAIGGALQSLDPHSSYFDAAEYGQFLSEEQSEYSGIGGIHYRVLAWWAIRHLCDFDGSGFARGACQTVLWRQDHERQR